MAKRNHQKNPTKKSHLKQISVFPILVLNVLKCAFGESKMDLFLVVSAGRPTPPSSQKRLNLKRMFPTGLAKSFCGLKSQKREKKLVFHFYSSINYKHVLLPLNNIFKYVFCRHAKLFHSRIKTSLLNLMLIFLLN